LSVKDFIIILLFFFLIFSLVIAGIIFFQFRKVSKLEERLKKINQSRSKVQLVLQNHAFVKQQQESVKEILEKEKYFMITEFFEGVVKNLALDSKTKKEEFKSLDVDLNNGYEEERLESNFKDMNMKEVVRLLNQVEQEERVYVKKIELSKSPKAKKLDVNLVIATLRPKVVT
jgi:hypothetical protein